MTDIHTDLHRSRAATCSRAAARSSSASASPARQLLAARGDVAGPPDQNAIDTWIAIHADNTATVYIGKCRARPGQHHRLAADRGRRARPRDEPGAAARLDTNVTPNQGATSSSSSIERGGPQLRSAAAEARRALLVLAPRAGSAYRSTASSCRRAWSRSTDEPIRSVTYGDLIGDKPFNLKFTGTAPQKADTVTSSSARACRASTCRRR